MIDEIEAALDAGNVFSKPVQPHTNTADLREDLPLNEFHGRHTALDIDDIEFGPLLRNSNPPEHFDDHIFGLFCHYKASAPEMISINSLVICAWRWRLYLIDSLLIMSPALRVALSMALIRAPCSEAAFSRSPR